MKTSVVLLVLLFFNTTALLSNSLANFIDNTNPWIFIGIELILVITYLLNKTISDIRKTMEVDTNYLNLYLTKYKK